MKGKFAQNLIMIKIKIKFKISSSKKLYGLAKQNN
jgi:hypothetical protein